MRARNLRRAQREVWKLAGRNPADWATRQPEKRRFTKTQDWLLKGLAGMLLLIWGLLVGVLTLIWQAGGLGQ